MKKSVIKTSLAFGIIAALILILLGLRSCDRGIAPPSYRFLGGQNPVSFKKRYIYSFEADFNDLRSKADAELIPAGFSGNTVVDKTFSDNGSPCRMYYLKERFPRGPVWVYIYDNRQYIKLPNSEHSAFCEKDGWVMVEVVYVRGWRWPF